MLGNNTRHDNHACILDVRTQGPFRVLLVENADDDRADSLTALDSCDMVQEVQSYESGAALLTAMHDLQAEENSVFHLMPTIVILGLNLPAAEGFRTLKHLKAEKTLAGMPVFVLSDVLDSHQAQGLQADGCLQKPLNAEKLLECLSHGAGGRRWMM